MTRGGTDGFTGQTEEETALLKSLKKERRVIPWELRIDGSRVLSRLPLEGFVDFVAQVFDANVVAIDFFDEALAADARGCSAART